MASREEKVLAVLDGARVRTTSADWGAHDELVQALVEAVQLVYLRTDLFTGEVSSRIIRPNLDGGPIPLGAVPALVAPLVDMLEQLTDELDGQVVASELPAWQHWLARLAVYRDAVDSAGLADTIASRVVWERATLPLAAGIYPADFAELGISDPGVRSPPDVVYPVTVAFQIALAEQAERERWSLLWSELGERSKQVLRSLGEAITDGAGVLLWVGVGVGGALLLRALTKGGPS